MGMPRAPCAVGGSCGAVGGGKARSALRFFLLLPSRLQRHHLLSPQRAVPLPTLGKGGPRCASLRRPALRRRRPAWCQRACRCPPLPAALPPQVYKPTGLRLRIMKAMCVFMVSVRCQRSTCRSAYSPACARLPARQLACLPPDPPCTVSAARSLWWRWAPLWAASNRSSTAGAAASRCLPAERRGRGGMRRDAAAQGARSDKGSFHLFRRRLPRLFLLVASCLCLL